MNLQPNRNYVSDDVVYTPPDLAKQVINHFDIKGSILDPCKGGGAFYDNYPSTCEKDYCEIAEGKDFYNYNKKVDWIISNPPWSEIRNFLKHSMLISTNIVFLITVNHIFTKARLRDIEEAGFCVKEILLIDTPKNFPQSGFQLGAIYLAKGQFENNIKFNRLKEENI